MSAKRVQELDVWQLCEEIRVLVTAKIESGAGRTDLDFCNQIRDAAEDAVADISEGFNRFRPREFAQFLGYAISSTAEVLERVRAGHSRKYFDDTTAARLVVLCTRADLAMRSLRRYLWRVDPEDVPYHPASHAPRRKRRSSERRRGNKRD